MDQKMKLTPESAEGVSTNLAWTGTPTVLQTGDNASMPQTTNGTMIVAMTNQSTQNNDGTITLTSGGSAPQTINVPALVNQPTIDVQNFQANNLSLTNTSANSATPINIQAVGPGIPGITPLALPIGTATTLAYGTVAQGTASPQFMNLVLQANGATLAIFGIIGGPVNPAGSNGYVIAVNAPANTGPPTSTPATGGYYATTIGNTYTFQFNWGASNVFVANLSPQQTSVPVTAKLVQL